MFSMEKILFNLILIIVQQEPATTEWVEVPQFSNNAKVYRIPLNKYDQKNIFLNNHDGPKIYRLPNATAVEENFHRRVHQQFSIDGTTLPSLGDIDSSQIVSTMENVYLSDDNGTYAIPRPTENNEAPLEDGFVEVEEENEEIVTSSMIPDQSHQATPLEDHSQPDNPEPEAAEDEVKGSFLAYIPLELFKRVHAILQSRSTTVQGKIEFFKRFQKTLLDEIEKKLVPVIDPVRKKRGARGDHGWDDHDDSSVGFPSLEGALMAIAFLTFAVYLVQLVMMLFRNLGNNPATPGTATVLFNRNKRSVDQFNEDTARILNYLDKFAQNQSIN